MTGGWSSRIAQARLALPLAMLMAAASGFLIYAMPATVAEPALAGLGIDPLTAVAIPFATGPRAVAGLVLALVSGRAVWMLFDRLGPSRPRAVRQTGQARSGGRGEASAGHARPVAEARRPLFAASDLGAPLDDVASGSTPFGRPPLFHDEPPVRAVSRPVPGEGEASISNIMRRLELEIARGDEAGPRLRSGPDHHLSAALTTLRRAVADR